MIHRYFLALSVFGGLTAAALPVHAKTKETTLPKASNWLLDAADKSCLLARKFGTDDKPVLLGMRTYGPGYHFEITLSGAPARILQTAHKFTIAYGGGEPLPVRSYQMGKNDDYGAAVIFSNTLSMTAPPQEKTELEEEDDIRPVAIDPAVEAQIDTISIATNGQRFILKTGPMAKALATVRQCTDGLVTRWGLDPVAQSKLSRRVRLGDFSWIEHVQRIYPAELMLKRKEARVNMQIVVDKTGAATRCDTAQAFANTDFKVRACGIVLKEARFQPALDESGQPIDSYYTTTILYKIS